MNHDRARPQANPASVTALGKRWWSRSVKNKTINARVNSAATRKAGPAPRRSQSATSEAALSNSTNGSRQEIGAAQLAQAPRSASHETTGTL